MSWKLSGTYIESCSCHAICPCITLSPPTEGTCDAVVAWHIDRGEEAGVSLDGLNVAMVLHTPGRMIDGGWRAMAYVDERASEEQRGALLRIFGGQAGGHLAGLAPLISEHAGVKSVPFEFHQDGGRFHVKIGQVADVAFAALEGADGAPVLVSGHPLAISPGVPATVGRTSRSRVDEKDQGWSWVLDGRQAMFAPFSYAG